MGDSDCVQQLNIPDIFRHQLRTMGDQVKVYLQTQRPSLREVTECDPESLIVLNGDSEVMRHLAGGMPLHPDQIRQKVLPQFLRFRRETSESKHLVKPVARGFGTHGSHRRGSVNFLRVQWAKDIRHIVQDAHIAAAENDVPAP